MCARARVCVCDIGILLKFLLQISHAYHRGNLKKMKKKGFAEVKI